MPIDLTINQKEVDTRPEDIVMEPSMDDKIRQLSDKIKKSQNLKRKPPSVIDCNMDPTVRKRSRDPQAKKKNRFPRQHSPIKRFPNQKLWN